MLASKMQRNPSHRRVAPFDFESPTAIAEIKTRPTAKRQIREALVHLIHGLGATRDQEKWAFLILIQPKITAAALEAELEGLKSAMRPDLARRLQLIAADPKRTTRFPAGIPEDDLAELQRLISKAAVVQKPLSRPDMQSEALRVLILQWLLDAKPVTFDGIAKTVGCTYRTVAAVVENLGPAVERTAELGIRLKAFPAEAWARFLSVSRKARATTQYVDRSRQPRSAEFLVKRLQASHRDGIAVGGVLGAKHHFPDLDLVSSPRLDLCVHAQENQFDYDVVHALDPGLERVDRSELPPRVVIHFLRRKTSFFERDTSGILWADPIECLADLHEARMNVQADQFESFLMNRRSG